tara:strand:+ start:688 stop:1047 length:360 start_codon:yes stop_codon:yes gene_type:complete
MDPDRRAYWLERQADETAAANNAKLADPRRRVSALFAGQAAQLTGAAVTDNPFPPRSRLFERWEAGWYVGSRSGDPHDARAVVAPAGPPAGGETAPAGRHALKLPKHAATFAAHTHPED